MVGSIYIPRTGSVSTIIDTDDVEITGEDADVKQFIIDLLTDPGRNKPLGTGFQSNYDMQIDGPDGTQIIKPVGAEEYLTQQGYRHVYFARDAGEVARDLNKDNIALLKTQMSNVGIMDASKTVGLAADEEFIKGIKQLMEFSMNTGGKISWLGALSAVRSDYNARKAMTTGSPKIETEEIDELLNDTLTKAKARKGGALSTEERNYISSRVTGLVGQFNRTSANLGQGTPAEFGYVAAREGSTRVIEGDLTVSTPSTMAQETFTPGTASQEPDVEGLQEDISGVVDEVFEGREDLERQSQAAGQIGARAANTINSLTSLSRRAVDR